MRREYRDIVSHKQIALYGIGTQFNECYKLFEKYSLLLCDSDPNKVGMKIDENIIVSPMQLKQKSHDDFVVVITSIKNQYEIAQYLYRQLLIPSDRIFMYTSQWYEDYVYKVSLIEKNWNRILSCADRFSDEESKKYYLNSAMARLTRNPLFLEPNVNSNIVGEYAGKVTFEQGEQIIDCGAYTGDTAELYMNKLKGKCHVYAVEPYWKNYEKMLERIQNKHLENGVEPFYCAVGYKSNQTVLQYNENDFGMGMGLLKQGGDMEQPITVKTIDEIFSNKKITYIKMDIEGEEKAALDGAMYVIRHNKPKLMISGYHKIEDLWEIPETIWKINEDYKIYVGHAPEVSMEIEFYCTL